MRPSVSQKIAAPETANPEDCSWQNAAPQEYKNDSWQQAISELQVLVEEMLHPLMQSLKDLSTSDTFPADSKDKIEPCLNYWENLHNDDSAFRGILKKRVDIDEPQHPLASSEAGDVQPGAGHSPPNSDASPPLVGGSTIGDEWNSEIAYDDVDARDLIDAELADIIQDLVELELKPETEATISTRNDLEARRDKLFDDRHLHLQREALRRSRLDLSPSQPRDPSTYMELLDNDYTRQLVGGSSHIVLTGSWGMPAAHTLASMGSGRGSHRGVHDYNDVASGYGQINQATVDIPSHRFLQLEHELEEKTRDLLKIIRETTDLRIEAQHRLRTEAPPLPLPDRHRLLTSTYRISSIFQRWSYTFHGFQQLLGEEPSLLPR